EGLRLVMALSLFASVGWSSTTAQAPQPDDASVRSLVAEFFAMYQKRDVDRLMALWSANSPELAQNKNSVLKSFQMAARLEWGSCSIEEIKLDGESASVRANLRAPEGQRALASVDPAKQRMHITLDLIKSEGAWRIWRYKVREERLAAALVTATSDEE